MKTNPPWIVLSGIPFANTGARLLHPLWGITKNVVLSILFSIHVATAAADDGPLGYIVVTGWYKDAGVQRQYATAVRPVLDAHGYQTSVIGLSGSTMRVIEGDWIPGRTMLLIRFPSESAAKGFWWSDAYQDVKKIRMGAANLDVIQVDGVVGVRPDMDENSAYLVFVGAVKDMRRFLAEYAPEAPEVVRRHGGKFIIRASRADMELLEGAHPPGSLVVIEFPDVKAMQTFWNSDDYRRLSEIRKATGKWSVVEIVPGM